MSNDTRPVEVLRRAVDQAHAALAAVVEGQHGDPTPCGDWDVATLAGHLVATPGNFLTMMQGGQPDWAAGPEPVTEGYADRFRADADALLAAWEGAAEVRLADWQTAELAVHTWDLARATGQPVEVLDDEVAERGLAFMTASMKDEMRGDAFGPARQAGEGASAHDRLAAFAGREV